MARNTLKVSKVQSGVSISEIIDIAVDNIGINWTIDGCTDFVWGVTNLAGVPFFDLNDKTVDSAPIDIV